MILISNGDGVGLLQASVRVMTQRCYLAVTTVTQFWYWCLLSPFWESRSECPYAWLLQWDFCYTSSVHACGRCVLFSCPCWDSAESRGRENLALILVSSATALFTICSAGFIFRAVDDSIAFPKTKLLLSRRLMFRSLITELLLCDCFCCTYRVLC